MKILLIFYWFILFRFAIFAWSLCFTSSTSFSYMVYFLSSSWYFFLISPVWWYSKMFMCFLTSFVIFLILLFHQGSDSFFYFVSTSFKTNLFSYIDYNCFYQDICLCKYFQFWFVFLYNLSSLTTIQQVHIYQFSETLSINFLRPVFGPTQEIAFHDRCICCLCLCSFFLIVIVNLEVIFIW